MTSDSERLAAHTHLTQDEAALLLETRSLTGNPEDHTHPAVIISDDEVVVETRHAFNNGGVPSLIEMAFSCQTTVAQVRDRHKADGDVELQLIPE